MEWVVAVSGALVEVIILFMLLSFANFCLSHDQTTKVTILSHRHGLRHDPWWSWILTFRSQRRKWHEPRWILACLEPPAWQPGQSCYEPLHTKVCEYLSGLSSDSHIF